MKTLLALFAVALTACTPAMNTTTASQPGAVAFTIRNNSAYEARVTLTNDGHQVGQVVTVGAQGTATVTRTPSNPAGHIVAAVRIPTLIRSFASDEVAISKGLVLTVEEASARWF
jgi:hypothetical protein